MKPKQTVNLSAVPSDRKMSHLTNRYCLSSEGSGGFSQCEGPLKRVWTRKFASGTLVCAKESLWFLSRTELIGANLCVCLLDLEQKRDVMTVRCSSKLKKNKNKKRGAVCVCVYRAGGMISWSSMMCMFLRAREWAREDIELMLWGQIKVPVNQLLIN